MGSTLTKALSLSSAIALSALLPARAESQQQAAHGSHAAAQTTHAHQAPHGGQIVQAGMQHVEFKADSSGLIQLWVLDGNQQAVAPPSDATVMLMGNGGSMVTLPLKVDSAGQRLTTEFDPRAYPSFEAMVTLPVAGKRHDLRFRYPVLAAQH